MSKIWIIGDFISGAISEVSVLPVISGSDEINLAVSGEDYATLKLSKADLPNPAQWKTFLKPGYKMIAAVDTDAAWNSKNAVLFAGFIKEVEGEARSAIQIQVAGLREYASNRIVSSIQTGTATDAKAGTKFDGVSWAAVQAAIIQKLFSRTGLPSGSPVPPDVLGTLSTAPGGTSKSFTALNVNSMTFSEVMDEIRDVTSENGEEYQFVPRWSSSAKNKIVFDGIIGTASAPHINYSTQKLIDLSGSNTAVGASTGLTFTDYATKMFSISKHENDVTDFTAFTAGSSSDLLVDTVFNPGVELTTSELQKHSNDRLAWQKLLQENGEALVVEDVKGEWVNSLGAKLKITTPSTGDLSGYALDMRIVGLSFSLSNSRVKLQIMNPKPRYGKLPNSPSRPQKFPNPSKPGPGTNPITPYLPPNAGGGGGGVPMPAPPTFEPPTFKNGKPFFINLKAVSKNIPGGGSSTGEMQSFPIGDTSSISVMRPSGWTSRPSTTPSQSYTHANAAACEADWDNTNLRLGSAVSPQANQLNSFTIEKITYSKNSNPVYSSMMAFNISDHFTSWESWQNNKSMSDLFARSFYPSEHSAVTAWHEAACNAVHFTHNNEIYLWILSTRSVSFVRSNIENTSSAIASTRLYKNSISGTASTWELVGQDIEDPDGRIFFPYSTNSIVSSRQGLLFYGGLRFDNDGFIASTGVSEQVRADSSKYRLQAGQDFVEFPQEDLREVLQPYYDPDVLTLSGTTMTKKPQYQVVRDLTETERTTLNSSYNYGFNLVPSSKIDPETVLNPRFKYFAKRSGTTQAAAVFQLPAWSLTKAQTGTPDPSDFDPDGFTDLSVFNGDLQGNLNRLIEYSPSGSYVSGVLTFTYPIVGYVNGWYFLLFRDTSDLVTPGWFCLRTKGAGGAWVKSFESELTNLMLGTNQVSDLGWRATKGYQFQPSAMSTILTSLSGPQSWTYGDYGVFTFKQNSTSTNVWAVSFNIDPEIISPI